MLEFFPAEQIVDLQVLCKIVAMPCDLYALLRLWIHF